MPRPAALVALCLAVRRARRPPGRGRLEPRAGHRGRRRRTGCSGRAGSAEPTGRRRAARRAALLRGAVARARALGCSCWRATALSSARAVVGAVVAAHVLFLLAPPLLSQDVFSYIAYARLGVEHDLNPYEHAPDRHALRRRLPIRRLEGRDLGLRPALHAADATARRRSACRLRSGSSSCSLALRVARRWWPSCGAPPRAAGPRPAAGRAVRRASTRSTLVHVVGGAHNEALRRCC